MKRAGRSSVPVVIRRCLILPPRVLLLLARFVSLRVCDSSHAVTEKHARGEPTDSVASVCLLQPPLDSILPTTKCAKLISIHVCTRSVLPSSVLRGAGARLVSLAVCACAAPKPSRVRRLLREFNFLV
jgi:hypothetical protein